jgi:hypothetical protein
MHIGPQTIHSIFKHIIIFVSGYITEIAHACNYYQLRTDGVEQSELSPNLANLTIWVKTQETN